MMMRFIRATAVLLAFLPIASAAPAQILYRLIDVDTIEVTEVGKVRLIGIKKTENGAVKKEAMTALVKLALGQKVSLEYDARRKDKDGRILASIQFT